MNDSYKQDRNERRYFLKVLLFNLILAFSVFMKSGLFYLFKKKQDYRENNDIPLEWADIHSPHDLAG